MVSIIMMLKENRAKVPKCDLNGLLGREKSDILNYRTIIKLLHDKNIKLKDTYPCQENTFNNKMINKMMLS